MNEETCMMCVESNLKCPECKCGCDLDRDTDLDDGDVVECNGCGEEWRFWLGELVSEDDYQDELQECEADSQAAADYEDRAHGDDREHYISGGRWESGYRNGREDFRSDC